MVGEIRYLADTYGRDLSIDTIYFGGGTPSLLAIDHIHRILDTIHASFDTRGVTEITFELNPDDASSSYLSALSETGVNRLSIGIQSFFNEDLRWMHRAHTADQAMEVIPVARDAGFGNFSIDLIFGLPEQDLLAWAHNLELALRFEAPHISTYSLTIEPKTPLARRVQNNQETPVTETRMETLFKNTTEALCGAGYEHYEVSSFARPGYRAVHNQSYWQHSNYLGVGPSAHSFWQEEDAPARRWENVRSLSRYTSWIDTGTIPVAHEETLTKEALLDEYILLRLRTKDGLDLHQVRDRFGKALDVEKEEIIEHLIYQKLIEIAPSHTLRLTEAGFLVCDAITQALLS